MGRRSAVWADFQRIHQAEKLDRARRREGEGPGWGISAPRDPGPLFGPGGVLPIDPVTFEGPYVATWGVSTSRETADVPSRELVKRAARLEAERVVAGIETPPGKTGSKFTVHWASITVFCQSGDVADLLANELWADFEPFVESGLSRFGAPVPTRLFERLYVGPFGVSIKAGPRLCTGLDYCCVDLPGEFFDVKGMTPLGRLMASCEDRGWRWHLTRVDNAFDGVELSPLALYEVLKAGQVRSNAERKTLRLEMSPFGDEDDPAGETCYWGRRGSADLLRLYNRRGFNRLEHECRRHRARTLGMMLVHVPVYQWARVALSVLRDFLDLVDVGPGENVSRAKLLPCWREFVQSIPRCRVNLSAAGELKERAVETVGRVLGIWKGIVRRLAVVQRVVPVEVLRELQSGAGELLRAPELSVVETLRATVGEYADAYRASVVEAFEPLLQWQRRQSLVVSQLRAGGG